MDNTDKERLKAALQGTKKPKAVLLCFTLYCAICHNFWSQDEYHPKQWQCKCGSTKVRVRGIEKVYGI